MAKTVTIGSVYKTKDGKGTYIKIKDDVVLKKDQFVNLVNEENEVDDVKKMVLKDLLTETQAEKRIEQIKEYWNSHVAGLSGPRKNVIKFNLTTKVND